LQFSNMQWEGSHSFFDLVLMSFILNAKLKKLTNVLGVVMEFAMVLIMVLIVVAIVAVKFSVEEVSFPFTSKSQLFSPVEHQFLDMIEKAVGNEFRVMCRVKLTDVLALRKNTNKKVAKSAFLRAGGKQLDFVLVSKTDMTPVLALDLVHSLGREGHKTTRDFFVTGALDSAGIPHARIKAKHGYKIEDIKACIEAKIMPLRRRQGKLPMQSVEEAPSLFTPTKRPTRPVRSSRQVAA
jgi:type IV secretory pathway VirB3-like protein